MTTNQRSIAILAEGKFNVLAAKTAVGVLRYSPHKVVAVIDSENAGRTVQQVLGFGGDVPIVASLAETLSFAPDVLLIGIAPTGGQLPPEWRHYVNDALDNRLEIWSGLHAFLADDAGFLDLAQQNSTRIWDVRRPRPDLYVGIGAALKTRAYVVLTIGSDCNVGKMTVCLELQKLARERGIKAGFVATGQTGILISGKGTPLDAIPGDFMCGEVERLVLEQDAEGCDVIFVEGQGSISHPGFGPVTLGLMLGSMPDSYILCHQSSRTLFRSEGNIPLPPLDVVIRQYEQLMEYYKAPKVRAVALNTFDLSEDDARARVRETAALTGLPSVDPIRDGSAMLWDAIEPRMREKLDR